MNSPKFIISFFLILLPAQAKELSSCEYSCFEQKYACNINKSHTYNTCGEDLLACRTSCNAEKQKTSDSANAFIDISFRPNLVLN